MEKLLNIFLEYKEFIIISIIISSIVYIALSLMKITDKNSKKIFPLLLNIKNKDIIKLSLLISKYFLIMYILLSKFEIQFSILTIFIIIDSLYNIIDFDIVGTIFDYINSLFIFFVIFSNKIISTYIAEIKFSSILMTVNILLIIFLINYSIYMFKIKLLKLKKVT